MHHTFLNHDPQGGFPRFDPGNPAHSKSHLPKTDAVALIISPQETEALGTAIEVVSRDNLITDQNARDIVRKAANIAGISEDRVVGKIDPETGSAPPPRHLH